MAAARRGGVHRGAFSPVPYGNGRWGNIQRCLSGPLIFNPPLPSTTSPTPACFAWRRGADSRPAELITRVNRTMALVHVATQGMQQVMVNIPAGVTAGMQFQARAPDGQLLQIQVPPGRQPGESMQVSYVPSAPATMAMAQAPVGMVGAVGGGQLLCTLITVGGECCSAKRVGFSYWRRRNHEHTAMRWDRGCDDTASGRSAWKCTLTSFRW